MTPKQRFRTLHDDGMESVCLWFAVYDPPGTLYCYREHYGQALGAATFAQQVVRETPEDEEMSAGWCDAALWRDGAAAYDWRRNGVYCREAVIPEQPWQKLREFLAPVDLLNPETGKWETKPRLRLTPSCVRAEQAIRTVNFLDGKADGDVLALTALLVACLSRPRSFTVVRDRQAEEEAHRMERLRREFPGAFEKRAGKKS